MEPVVNMATWQTWQSKAMGVATERARQKFWGRGCLLYAFFRGCLLYSLSRPRRRKRAVLWVGCICTLAAHHISRARRHSTKRQSGALLLNNYTLCTFLWLCCRQPMFRDGNCCLFSAQLLLHFATCQLFQTVHQSCLSGRFLPRPPSAYLFVCCFCLPLSNFNLPVCFI